MDWQGNLRTFVSRPQNSFNFLYNYSYDQNNQGMDVKHQALMAETPQGIHPAMEKLSYGIHEKKRRLTNGQLESLERSFREEIKLDADRKMKLSRELGLQPRQIAVWFQNRRARWKAKQLELLYDGLKQEFDAVSLEKQKLQEEVMKLKGILREQAVSTGYTEISGEETVESTWVGIRSSGSGKPGSATSHQQQIGDQCNYLLNVDEYNNPVISPCWAPLPSHP